MNMLDRIGNTLSSIFSRVNSGTETQTITCAADTRNLPQGFFIARFPSGREELGYSFSPAEFSLPVRKSFQHPCTKETIVLTVPPSALPIFNWNIRVAHEGVVRAGGMLVMDTDSQAEKHHSFNGDVRYDGTQQASGVSWV